VTAFDRAYLIHSTSIRAGGHPVATRSGRQHRIDHAYPTLA
jgi:hypothetical protein